VNFSKKGIYIFRYVYVLHKPILPFFFSLSFFIFFLLYWSFQYLECALYLYFIAQFWTEIFDIVLQINVSRSRIMPIMTEYFVDQEKYFYFILLWTNVTICVQAIVILAIGTTFITFFQYIHGMFKIARYTNKNIN